MVLNGNCKIFLSVPGFYFSVLKSRIKVSFRKKVDTEIINTSNGPLFPW